MRKDLLAIGLGLVLSSATVVSSVAAGSRVSLHGHVPSVVSRGSAADLGEVNADQTMGLSIGLPLRNREVLTNLLQQLSDPKSPNYGHFLTTKQFTDAFGPTEKDYQAVIDFAVKNGLKVTRTHANRMLVDVSGRAGDIEKTFGVSLRRYVQSAGEFFAPANEPSIPAGLQIQDIEGLNNLARPHAHSHLTPGTTGVPVQTVVPKAQSKNANPKAGSGPGGLYMGDDFRNAYVSGATTLTGAGQAVALVQFDGYFASDITAYETLTGRPNVSLQNVLIDGFNGLPVNPNGQMEVSLDIEMVISMAPQISKIIVYEGSPSNFHPNDVLNQIAVDNAARQVSSSWGWTIGGPNLTTDQIFQQMAVQGQTYFNATGDSDAFLPGQVDNPFYPGQPSSSPFITQVGGTTLTMNGAGAAYASETVWNWGISLGEDGVGSSGGISTFYAIPSYQTNINMALRQGSQTNRNIPDVAMVGDNVLVIASGLENSVGGTSVAAPLWGGFTALINQQAAADGHGPVGFINPALYAIASSQNYNNCFRDTVTGNNTSFASPDQFFATQGYDLCTGLGTPNGKNLIDAILSTAVTGPIHISPPRPPYSTNLSAVSGGNPNGSWFMFIQDDAPVSSGSIGNGWILGLTTADIIGTSGDIELLMSTADTSVLSGRPITFVLTATNYGPSISTNVSVIDTLPNAVTIVSTNTTQGTVSRSGSTLTWNIGTLDVGAGAGLVLTVQPIGPGTFINSANVDAGTPDANPDDDFATATAGVIPSSIPLTPSFVRSNGMFQLSIPAPSGISVIVQANTNLLNTNWVNIYTGTPPVIFNDPASSNYTTRFYRAIPAP